MGMVVVVEAQHFNRLEREHKIEKRTSEIVRVDSVQMDATNVYCDDDAGTLTEN